MAEKRPITIDDLYRIAHAEDVQVSPDGQWVAFVKVTVDRMGNGYHRNIWLAPTDGGEPFQLTRGNKDMQPRFSPDGKTLAFVSSRADRPQIYLLPLTGIGGEARALTDAIFGATSPAWSPDGAHIAYLGGLNAEGRAKEDSGEKPEPPADELEAKHRKERMEHDEKMRWDPRRVWRIPYRAGTSYLSDHFQQIYVVAVDESLPEQERKPRRLTDLDGDHTPPEWAPSGEWLYTSRMVDPSADEVWYNMALYRIRVSDGEQEQLTDLEGWSSLGPLPSPDGKWLAFGQVNLERVSANNGRLSVMPAEGGKIRHLNAEFDRDFADFVWSADSTSVIFIGNSEGNGEVYTVPVQGGVVRKISGGLFIAESLDVSDEGGIAFAASTPINPGEVYWQAPGADEPLVMTDLNGEFLDEVIVQETHELRFKSPDGTEIQGWYLYPAGYKQGEKYPLAMNIHGGPHAMWGPSARTMWHEWQAHAASGYAVFYCNPRGSSGYGDAFRDGIRDAWGTNDMPDQMAGLDEMLAMGFIDEDRIALTGGSYGGFMTGWLIGHTDRFACAVPQRGVYNNASFYGTSDIPRFIKTELGYYPWENVQALWEGSPVAHAHKITTPTLIIHSENDFRVPIEQGEQFFAIIRQATDTPVEMWRYPRDGHELSRSGEPRHRVSRLEKMVGWFDKYCKPE